MQPSHPTHELSSWQPIGGWPMEFIALVESQQPGRLWRLMHTSPRRRQGVFAALARVAEADELPTVSKLQNILDVGLKSSVRDVVEGAYGDCPNGFLGSLDKLGFSPLSPTAYSDLWQLLRAKDEESAVRARALIQLPTLSEDILHAALTLTAELTSPRVLLRVASKRAAERTNAQAETVLRMCSGETYSTVRQAIENDEPRAWPDWFCRKLERADRPFPQVLPTDGVDGFERITPHNATRIGAEFKNCLGKSERVLNRLLTGAFAMVAHRGDPACVVELVACDDGWVAPRVHMHANGKVTRDAMVAMRQVLFPLGVRLLIPVEPPAEMRLVREQPLFGGNLVELVEWD